MVNNRIERNWNRGLVAKYNHPKRVAYENGVDSGAVEQSGHRGVVGGQHRDFAALPLPPRQIVYANFFQRGLHWSNFSIRLASPAESPASRATSNVYIPQAR